MAAQDRQRVFNLKVWSWWWIHILLGIIAILAGAELVSGAIPGHDRGSSGSRS
jgi:hypothetical protein